MHISGTIAAILMLAEYKTCTSSMLPKPARKPWPAGLYPDIERDLAGCGRLTPNSLLCDPDQLISTEQADQVSTWYAGCHCCCLLEETETAVPQA